VRSLDLDSAAAGPYDVSIMEKTVTDQLKSTVEQQPSYWWFYFYFTPPASLVGYSGLSR